MKVAWASNAPWVGTGYGQQTAQVITRMKGAGHEVAVTSNYGLQGDRINWNGIPVYPSGFDQWSNDTIPAWAVHWFGGLDAPGWIITLMDVWTFKSPMFQRMNVASWVPVDHHPCPPMVAGWFKRFGAVPIAMSKFGREALARDGVEALYAPHGIDTGVFRPVDGARERLGLPEDRFIVGMVANNKGRSPSRKSFPESFLAFGMFHAKHPDSLLYVHAERDGASMGLQLDALAEACGIPADALLFPEQAQMRIGADVEVMRDLHNSFDVLLAPSRGEGFGIPVVEAQACGTPVICTNATAQIELTGDGWLVDGQPEWDPDQLAWWTTPSIQELIGALEEAYKRGVGNVSELAVDFAAQYDADRVFAEHWVPVLEHLEARFPTTEPVEATPVDFGELVS